MWYRSGVMDVPPHTFILTSTLLIVTVIMMNVTLALFPILLRVLSIIS
jgi:hypothetical protein